MLRVGLVRDYDEERLFGIRLYGDRLRERIGARCELRDVYPRPRRASGPPALRALQTLVVKEVLYPLQVARLRADVFHVVDQSHAHLLRFLRDAPTVVTCHDLWGLEFGGVLRRAGYRRRVGAMRAATRVIAVSQSARREALALGIDDGRIRVVRNRVDAVFTARPDDAALGSMRARLGARGEEFVLHVGNSLAYKNVEGLLAAIATVNRGRARPVPLVKAGATLEPAQAALAARLGVMVESVGAVSTSELRALYHLARCLAYPSRHEGFGWPVAEALACGCPVVASRAGAIPEVAGEAALLVDAGDAAGLAAAIARVLDDAALRERLGSAGRERGRWLAEGDSGAETLDVYREAAAAA